MKTLENLVTENGIITVLSNSEGYPAENMLRYAIKLAIETGNDVTASSCVKTYDYNGPSWSHSVDFCEYECVVKAVSFPNKEIKMSDIYADKALGTLKFKKVDDDIHTRKFCLSTKNGVYDPVAVMFNRFNPKPKTQIR